MECLEDKQKSGQMKHFCIITSVRDHLVIYSFKYIEISFIVIIYINRHFGIAQNLVLLRIIFLAHYVS